MRVLLYCPKGWAVSTKRMMRQVERAVNGSVTWTVLTAPPLDGETFPYHVLANVDVLYLRLHGLAGQSYLYDEKWRTAFSLPKFLSSGVQFTKAPLVFMEGCFGAKTRIPAELLNRGAGQVVACETKTKNYRVLVGPAGQVGKAVLTDWLNGQRSVDVALAGVKAIQDKYAMQFVSKKGAVENEQRV